MTINHNSIWQSTRIQWIVAIIVLGILVIALWLPYGLNFAGYGDEWVNLAAVDKGAVWFGGTLRTFLNIPYLIAHILTPNSFAGMNIILAIMTFGRGVGIYALLRKLLPENPPLALVAAGLTSVYPGDAGFYALVCISITSALVFLIVALVALVDYWQHPRWYILMLMWGMLACSICIYEVSYPLILVSPLLLIYFKSGLDRRVLRVAFLWYLIPLIYVLINLIASLTTYNPVSYQTGMVNPDNSLLAILKGFSNVYIREFGQVWDWAVLSMPQGFSDRRTWLVMTITVLFGVALWLHMKSVEYTVSRRRYIIVLIGGAAALGIGYSLFSITNFRDGFYRTLFYGLPGAAIALAVFAWLLSQIQRIPRIVIAVLFLGIAIIYLSHTQRLSALLLVVISIGFLLKPNWGFVFIGTSLVGYAGATMMGYHILQPYSSLPARQQQLATDITTQAPEIKSKSLILLTVNPDTKQQYETVRNRYDVFQSMMQFVYKKYDIEAQICIPDGIAWGEFNTSCKFERDAVVISGLGDLGSKSWPYNRVIAFTYEPNRGAVLLNKIPPEWMSSPGTETYNPEAIINRNAPLPYRLKTVWSIVQ